MHTLFLLISVLNTQLAELNKKGIEAAVCGKIIEAEKYFRSAIKLDSNSFEAAFNLIKLFHMNDRYHDTVLFFIRFAKNKELSTLPMQLLNILSDCAVKDPDLIKACECCEILHTIFPEDVETTCKFSNLLIKIGHLGKAKSVLNQCYLINTSNPNLLTQLAIVESELGNYVRAEELHLQLIDMYSNHFLSYFNYGLFLSMLGRNEEALGLFNKCLKIVPNAPEALSAIEKLSQNSNSLLSIIYKSIESKMYDDVIVNLKKSIGLIDPIHYWAVLGDLPLNIASSIEDTDLVSPFLQVENLNLFDDLADKSFYLEYLEAFINKQESLIWGRAGKPTRLGKQSHEILLGSQNKYIDNVNKRLKREIFRYMSSRPLLGQIAQQRGLKNELSGWAVSLTRGGYQKRHIHPEAVVSGVLYVKLLEESRSNTLSEGNLLFSSSHGSRMITPKEGMVVLFPSYLAHETIPLTHDQERICIAFNFA
jgi:tetratricopeptide (TPR) repeat protein